MCIRDRLGPPVLDEDVRVKEPVGVLARHPGDAAVCRLAAQTIRVDAIDGFVVYIVRRQQPPSEGGDEKGRET